MDSYTLIFILDVSIYELIVIFCCTNFRGRDNTKASFISLWICPYFIGNVRVHRQIPHALYIWIYNYKTNKVPKIPLIPPPPPHLLDLPSHAHARYKNVQNTPLLRTTEPNLFQTLESLNSD